MRRFVLWIALFVCVAQVWGARPEKPSLSPVQLPYVFSDNRGSAWDIQADGSVGDGGNDLFDGGCRLHVNEQQYGQGGTGQMDSATGEIVLGPKLIRGLNVTRRIGCNQKLNYLRYTEVLDNPGATPIRATLRIHFNMGGSVQIAQPVVDQKKTRQPIGQIIGDHNNCMVHLGAGRGSKVLPRYLPQQGSDNVNVVYDVEVPARQTVAITHLIVRRSNPLDAESVLDDIAEKDVLKELSPEVARQVINFQRGQSLAGDIELLRGDVFDVVELRSGDQYKGAIKQEKYKLKAFWGELEIPADRVVAMFSAGQFRPRQLIVTTDGEIFGGTLAAEAVPLELSNGQTTSVPLTQITRLGYRKRAGEPEEWRFDKPLAMLRTGERMVVNLPATPINVATRYGQVAIKPDSLAGVAFVSDDHGVHDITLTDGSRFAGIVLGEVTLQVVAGPAEPVAFPPGELGGLRFAAPPEDADANRPTLIMTNGDQLVGTFAGQFNVQTAFDTLAVAGAEVRTLKRGNTAGEVQVTLWDGATVSGRLDGDTLPVSLLSRVSLQVPVDLIDVYANPAPRPSGPVLDRIRAIVAELNDDDARVRDRAEEQLTQIGPIIRPVLAELRAGQPPEAQQRIDNILKALAAEKAAR